MRLAIDVMGGDHAPEAVMEGVQLALAQLPAETELLLFGDADAIQGQMERLSLSDTRLKLVPTTQLIGCDEQPTAAIRTKKDSSLVRAIRSVADGECDCVLSAGSSGALLAGATLLIRRQKGVKRPALAPLLPTVTGGQVMLLDAGANADCKPEYLLQFAYMGKAYMEQVQELPAPRIALLNNGTEAEKGSELSKAAYGLLSKATDLNFVGNCEARELMSGDYDVIVTDGFSGNVLLKSTEGTAKAVTTLLKEELLGSTRTKLGALLAKPAFKRLKKRMDYTEVGGAALLGVNGGVIKAHGSSNGNAFFNAILQAERLVSRQVTERIGKSVASLAEQALTEQP